MTGLKVVLLKALIENFWRMYCSSLIMNSVDGYGRVVGQGRYSQRNMFWGWLNRLIGWMIWCLVMVTPWDRGNYVGGNILT